MTEAWSTAAAGKRPAIAITLGDPAGIGPEIAIKAALDAHVQELCVPLLVGDLSTAELHAERCGIPVSFAMVVRDEPVRAAPGSIPFLHCDLLHGEPLRLGEIAPIYGRAAIGAAETAIEAAVAGQVDAVVACPQTQQSIRQAGIEFDGYPSLVARRTGTPVDDVFLMICFDDMRITHVTLHASLRRVIELITTDRVLRAIRVTAEALRHLGIANPRLAVSGLNPHAGEHGLFGSDDEEVIVPAIAQARAEGLVVDGPIGADTLFDRKGYDAFVVMFHDQGHVAAKLLAPRRIAGLMIGAPILFSSVAHGSALDIAGLNRASPAAVIEAIERLTLSAARPVEPAQTDIP